MFPLNNLGKSMRNRLASEPVTCWGRTRASVVDPCSAPWRDSAAGGILITFGKWKSRFLIPASLAVTDLYRKNKHMQFIANSMTEEAVLGASWSMKQCLFLHSSFSSFSSLVLSLPRLQSPKLQSVRVRTASAASPLSKESRKANPAFLE